MVVTMVDTLDEDARKDLERIEEEAAAEAVEDYDAMDEEEAAVAAAETAATFEEAAQNN